MCLNDHENIMHNYIAPQMMHISVLKVYVKSGVGRLDYYEKKKKNQAFALDFILLEHISFHGSGQTHLERQLTALFSPFPVESKGV